MAKRSTSRKSTSLAVVEDHDEALYYIYRAIASKKLPIEGNVLIHFDSHPDMLIPKALDADDIYEKDKLFASLSIENWILPAVFAGHISHVIWCKSNWCQQMTDKSTKFYIGKHSETGKIRVSSTETYFTSECLYSREDELVDKKKIHLHIVTFDLSSESHDSHIQSVNTILQLLRTRDDKQRGIILDCDLDFFSVQNPLKLLLSNEAFVAHHEVYYLPPTDDEDRTLYTKKKEKFNDVMRKVIVDGLTMSELDAEHVDFIENLGRAEAIQRLVQVLKPLTELDKEMSLIIHEFGLGMDADGLPHHRSSDEEIATGIKALGLLAKEMAQNHFRPHLITIARSSDDDYCPRDQVDAIQAYVIATLKDHFPDVSMFQSNDTPI